MSVPVYQYPDMSNDSEASGKLTTNRSHLLYDRVPEYHHLTAWVRFGQPRSTTEQTQ
jgi:hypothetical protein